MKKRTVGSFFVDHPAAVTWLLVLLVGIHYTIGQTVWPDASPHLLVEDLSSTDRRTALSDLAVGLAGVAAMVGGFAGVVVVFGLSSDDERFRVVRLRAVSSLRRNWTSVVTTPLVAAFGALIAAILASAGLTTASTWFLEICILFAAHGAVRLVVILGELVKVVHKSDQSVQARENQVDDDIFFGAE